MNMTTKPCGVLFQKPKKLQGIFKKELVPQ